MAEKTTVTIPRPLQKRIATLARNEGKTQPELIMDLVRMREDQTFWAAMRSITPQEYRAAMLADGDNLNEDYDLENQPIAVEEAKATW
jgi:hypothetical protein